MRRRTHFASPFVITIACGGAPAPTTPTSTPEGPEPPFPYAHATSPELGPAPAPPALPAVGTIRFDDPVCERHTGGGSWKTVDCPDDLLPLAGKDELVVSADGKRCFLVYERKLGERTSRYEWDEGRVRCPPGGPNVRLPSRQQIQIDGKRFRLEPESLTCREEMLGNPPSWRRAECPALLVPQLVGLKPDAPCSYRGVKVNCGAGSMQGRVIGASAVHHGVTVTVALGTREGVGKGMVMVLKDGATVVRATIDHCSERTCRATLPTTVETVRRVQRVWIE